MIDKKAFADAFTGFDADVINEIINIYIIQHPQKFSEMEDSLRKNDLEKIRHVAHGLKGILSQFYAAEGQQQAKDLEFYTKELIHAYREGNDFMLKPENHEKLRTMIENLKNSSIQVIDDLKVIQKKL